MHPLPSFRCIEAAARHVECQGPADGAVVQLTEPSPPSQTTLAKLHLSVITVCSLGL